MTKTKRTQLSISLPPDLASLLTKEADARLVNPSLLVEKAVAAYLPSLPPLDGAES